LYPRNRYISDVMLTNMKKQLLIGAIVLLRYSVLMAQVQNIEGPTPPMDFNKLNEFRGVYRNLNAMATNPVTSEAETPLLFIDFQPGEVTVSNGHRYGNIRLNYDAKEDILYVLNKDSTGLITFDKGAIREFVMFPKKEKPRRFIFTFAITPSDDKPLG